MTTPPIARGADGYFHPASEAEVIALVNYARANSSQIRVRGATHSAALSIFTDPVDGKPINKTLEQVPPSGDNLNLALDQLMALSWIDEAGGVVEAEAGIHLGHDPNDPFGSSTLENSFLHQIYLKGWAVDTLGGITHQTISGFTGTGSAGGSVMYGFNNVIAFRVVDGLGVAGWIVQGDPAFPAMLTSVGLLGIVVKMRFQLIKMYNIAGTEVTTSTGADCPVNLFSLPDDKRPTLQQFLTETPYARITWWPQAGCERVQVWQASRVDACDKGLTPYQEFTPDFMGQAKQLAASLFFVLLGNTSMVRIQKLLAKNVAQVRRNLTGIWTKGWLGGAAPAAAQAASLVLAALVHFFALILGAVPGTVKALFTTLMPVFNQKTGSGPPTRFSDWYWRSLCMDNTADDVLLASEFAELWVPIQHSATVVNLLQGMFTAKGSKATGYYALEVYAAAPSPGWINPGYTDGTDVYKDGTIRIDLYWYRDNEGAPNVTHAFFDQYWNLLRGAGLPLRFHWGKFVPFYDFPDWAAFYAANLPKLDDFLQLRAERDPAGVFFTQYWQLRLTGAAQPPA